MFSMAALSLASKAGETAFIDLETQSQSLQKRVESAQVALDSLAQRAGDKTLAVTVAVSLSLHPDYLKDLAQSCFRLQSPSVSCRLAVQGVPIDLPLSVEGVGNKDLLKETLMSFVNDDQTLRIRRQVKAGLKRLSEATAPVGAEIDPQFFIDYGIYEVPVFVFEHFEKGLKTAAGIMTGAVSLEVALDEDNARFLEAQAKTKRLKATSN